MQEELVNVLPIAIICMGLWFIMAVPGFVFVYGMPWIPAVIFGLLSMGGIGNLTLLLYFTMQKAGNS